MPIAMYIKNNQIAKIAVLIIAMVAVIDRLYFYIFCKNLWLDESSIALALFNTDLYKCLNGNLGYNQSCPFSFMLIGKILSITELYSEHCLYFPSLIIGLLSIYLIYKISIESYDILYTIISCTFTAISAILLYYSSEFKQYIYEFLISEILILLYIRIIRKRDFVKVLSVKYQIIFLLSLLTSTPSIFVIFGIVSTTFIVLSLSNKYKIIYLISLFIQKYIIFLLLLIAYYFCYLKQNANDFMYNYWLKMFFPISISNWPEYLKKIFVPCFNGLFEPINSKIMFPLALLGAITIYKKNKDLFIFFLFTLLISYIANFKFYPIGHEGVLGARLSLWSLPFYILLASSFIHFVFIIFIRKFCIIKHIIILLCIIIVIYYNFKYITSYHFMRQELSDFIELINIEKTEHDAVFAYSASKEPIIYNQIKNKKTFEFSTLDYNNLKDKSSISIELASKNMMKYNSGYIIYSHYGETPMIWENIKQFLKNNGYNIETLISDGAVLQRFSKYDISNWDINAIQTINNLKPNMFNFLKSSSTRRIYSEKSILPSRIFDKYNSYMIKYYIGGNLVLIPDNIKNNNNKYRIFYVQDNNSISGIIQYFFRLISSFDETIETVKKKNVKKFLKFVDINPLTREHIPNFSGKLDRLLYIGIDDGSADEMILHRIHIDSKS